MMMCPGGRHRQPHLDILLPLHLAMAEMMCLKIMLHWQPILLLMLKASILEVYKHFFYPFRGRVGGSVCDQNFYQANNNIFILLIFLVVQSDHSNPQTQLHQNHVTPIIPIVPKTFNCSPNEPAWPTSPATNGINLNPTFTAAFKAMPPTNSYTPNSTPKASSRSATPSQMAPPIPPRTGGISPTSQLAEDWRPGSASSSTASSSLHLAKSTPFSNDSLHLASNIVQRHRPGSSYSSDVIAQRMGSVERPSSNRTSTSHGALETIVQENCVPKTNAVEKTKWVR